MTDVEVECTAENILGPVTLTADEDELHNTDNDHMYHCASKYSALSKSFAPFEPVRRLLPESAACLQAALLSRRLHTDCSCNLQPWPRHQPVVTEARVLACQPVR